MPSPDLAAPGGVLTRRSAPTPFEVHLDVFEGPFDLLLGLIAKHKLDITEIALAQVTDEFIAQIRAAQAAGDAWDLSQASEFLLVAATLLDLKAARLLPGSGPEDEEDLALIEARDLLFARLLPELVMGITPEQLAMIAARAMIPKAPPSVGLEHLHAPHVSVREQAALLVTRLRRDRTCSFRALVADADSTLLIVARFLALLELYKEAVIVFDQAEPLADLTIRWTGTDEGEVSVDAEFDEGEDATAGDDAGARGIPEQGDHGE